MRNIKSVAVGSKNQVKIKAVASVLRDPNITVTGFDVPSNVSNQPFSDEETRQGAINRARACHEKGEVDLSIGLEGGVVETAEGLMLCNWGALVDCENNTFVASGAKILLPEQIAEQVRAGDELGVVMEKFTSVLDIRQKEGAIGVFTSGYVTRQELFGHIVKLLFGQYEYSSKQKAGD
ncbi:DUF84 family protein [Desertibacillus haloalkaliphilus]|uniref:DUF84 family protein n=1 Tax=Desertibacillus haloalkaliphilus TaxID=1328930 RepID=UPI001C2568B0|nr:DUF84 family protein [Desertibacillus haloalkaliphilus]MBU8905234.1 DUF84 family protein [Desertibacillus haloalkaliphilus]